MSKLPGHTLTATDPADKLQLYGQLGTLARKIHQLETPGFGWFIEAGGEVRAPKTSWSEYWDEQSFELTLDYLMSRQLIGRSDSHKLSGAFSIIRQSFVHQGYLLHGDLNADNVMVDKGKVSGIIDPAHALSGDPHLDLAIARMWQSEPQWHSFCKGYQCDPTNEMVVLYGAWVAASKLQWRHTRNKESGAAQAKLKLNQALADIDLN